MSTIQIRRPKLDDRNELLELFRIVITDTFMKDDIQNILTDITASIEAEIKAKKEYIDRDFESNGQERYFLLALNDEKIVGTIEYGPTSEQICKWTNNDLKGILKVGTIFVHPESQRKGIGNLLIQNIYITLQKQGIEEFCMDSGFKRAQEVWLRKYGEPAYLLEDCWGKGYSHMIWHQYKGCIQSEKLEYLKRKGLPSMANLCT